MKRLECQGRVCVYSVVSQGWAVWISYLAMLESIKPLGHGFLSLIKLFSWHYGALQDISNDLLGHGHP